MVWVDLDRRAATTLTRQLYEQLVARVLSGELAAGTRLPSSRQLAAEMKIARNVVIEVFEQLLAEGYVEARAGSGTFVARLRHLPTLETRSSSFPSAPASGAGRRPASEIVFACGVPDLSLFPRARWMAAARQVGFYHSAELWNYEQPAGCPELRQQIAAHLRQVKGLICSPQQVVVTAGGAQAVLLLGLLFRDLRPGALVEDPVVSFVPEILQRCGLDLTPMPVDVSGVVVDSLPSKPTAGLMFVSPSHQFPLGGTLPIQRRLSLLEYARRHDLFVVEDDYDSEFRFTGAPVSSLFRLEPRRVIHVGTFSKSLAPSLRLGFLVLPEDLVPAMERVLRPLNLSGSRYTQATVARFIAGGHLSRHVVRMRRVYERKMRALVQALHEAFGGGVTVSGHSTGLHLVARFHDRVIGPQQRESLAAAGVRFDMVDDYAWGGARHPDAAALGFGNLSLEQIAAGVRLMGAHLPGGA